ncbi:MAG: hypothetical protein QOF41_1782 [Methylobacteriaceae bacterium]|nr:hypothetical protein [Methylobacteriaceae bacterium]
MKAFLFAGAFGLITALSLGQTSAQMEGIGNGGLGDAKAQNQPTSVGINNGYGRPGYGAPSYGAPAYGAGPSAYRGRSVYVARHRHRHHRRHW